MSRPAEPIPVLGGSPRPDLLPPPVSPCSVQFPFPGVPQHQAPSTDNLSRAPPDPPEGSNPPPCPLWGCGLGTGETGLGTGGSGPPPGILLAAGIKPWKSGSVGDLGGGRGVCPGLGCWGSSHGAWGVLGCQDNLGVPGSVWGWWDPSRGAWGCFEVPFLGAGTNPGVPRSVLGCLGLFGVLGSVLECQHLSMAARTNPGVPGSLPGARTSSGVIQSGPIPGCQYLFWGPSQVPGPFCGCLGLFWGTRTHSGAPGSRRGCLCPC